MHNTAMLAQCGKYCRMLSIGVLVSIFSFSAVADERQYKIESAFLYNFFNYITWPGYSTPQALQKPLICVYGNDPIVPYLDYIRSRMAAERMVTIHIVTINDSTADCNILFIRHRISPRLLNSLANDTLIVFKPDDPLDRGGMIELSEEGERITIKINQFQLEQNGFQVSSRLLDLAQRIK